MNERNPIPWKIRHRLVIDAIGQNIPEASTTTPINLSLLARGACEQGVSATMVRQAILNNSADLFGMVPENVYKQANIIKSYLEVFQK